MFPEPVIAVAPFFNKGAVNQVLVYDHIQHGKGQGGVSAWSYGHPYICHAGIRLNGWFNAITFAPRLLAAISILGGSMEGAENTRSDGPVNHKVGLFNIGARPVSKGIHEGKGPLHGAYAAVSEIGAAVCREKTL